MLDVAVLLTKNLNPFSLERKMIDVKNRDIVYMFWDECIERTFYRHICDGKNFLYLNSKNVLYPKTAQIVLYYLHKNPTNIVRLRRCLQKNRNIVQFVYSRCFPEIYSLVVKQGIQLKGEFLFLSRFEKTKKSNQKQGQKDEADIADETRKHEDEKSHQKLFEKKLKRKALTEKNDGLKESAEKKEEETNGRKSSVGKARYFEQELCQNQRTKKARQTKTKTLSFEKLGKL